MVEVESSAECRHVRTGGRLCVMRNCGLCDERRMASSTIGLYSTTRVGSMPQLQLMITLGCTHTHTPALLTARAATRTRTQRLDISSTRTDCTHPPARPGPAPRTGHRARRACRERYWPQVEVSSTRKTASVCAWRVRSASASATSRQGTENHSCASCHVAELLLIVRAIYVQYAFGYVL